MTGNNMEHVHSQPHSFMLLANPTCQLATLSAKCEQTQRLYFDNFIVFGSVTGGEVASGVGRSVVIIWLANWLTDWLENWLTDWLIG